MGYNENQNKSLNKDSRFLLRLKQTKEKIDFFLIKFRFKKRNKLQTALSDKMWQKHKLGDKYFLVHSNGKKEEGWRISYYPLFGTWNNKQNKITNIIEEIWIDFDEPRALIEKQLESGIDFREMPLRYLLKKEETK